MTPKEMVRNGFHENGRGNIANDILTNSFAERLSTRRKSFRSRRARFARLSYSRRRFKAPPNKLKLVLPQLKGSHRHERQRIGFRQERHTADSLAYRHRRHAKRTRINCAPKKHAKNFDRPTKVALLNEQQATFLITLLRNNDIVVAFKRGLSQAVS